MAGPDSRRYEGILLAPLFGFEMGALYFRHQILGARLSFRNLLMQTRQPLRFIDKDYGPALPPRICKWTQPNVIPGVRKSHHHLHIIDAVMDAIIHRRRGVAEAPSILLFHYQQIFLADKKTGSNLLKNYFHRFMHFPRLVAPSLVVFL